MALRLARVFGAWHERAVRDDESPLDRYATALRKASRRVTQLYENALAPIVAIAPELRSGVYRASKAVVLALTQSVHKEVHATGVRVQAVLPGATTTELWDAAGTSISVLPKEIVMTTEDMVDAALSGLDQGEVVTIPALPDVAEWHALEHARDVMRPNLSRATPAARY